MTSRPDYLRYLASAKRSELAEKLSAEGFDVQTGVIAGNIEFDLVARRDGQATAYEFKAGPSERTTARGLEELYSAAKGQGFQFRVVVVNAPQKVNVEIPQLTERLHQVLVMKLPKDLAALPALVKLNQVQELNIRDVRIGEGMIRIAGFGWLEVTLDGSGADSFPFNFKLTLATDGNIASIDELTVDTSSFYEE